MAIHQASTLLHSVPFSLSIFANLPHMGIVRWLQGNNNLVALLGLLAHGIITNPCSLPRP